MVLLYRDQEYSPELGDQVDVYSEGFEPETAVVEVVGKKRIKVRYENQAITPAAEWVAPADCDMIARA